MALFCDLRTARTASDLIEEVGRHLGLRFGEATSLSDRIAVVGRGLRIRGRCVVVLDNFEAVERSAVTAVREWVGDAPEAQFLVTSRRLLVVAGERPLELGPLPLPSSPSDWECPSMRLFLDRARSVEPSFGPSVNGAEEVHRLVSRLEGVPLAIELAAGWMKRMDPGAALGTLGRGLLSLNALRPADEPSHQSLRNAIASSWRLLAPAEQTVAARLSMFRSGFDLEATVAVAGDGVADSEVPSVIETLREASILRVASSNVGRRWDMYEAIREFAALQLGVSADATATRRRHIAHFAAKGERWLAQLPTEAADRARDRLVEDRSNLCAAFESALEVGDRSSVARLALAVNATLRGHMPARSVECLSSALASVSRDADEDRAPLLLARAEAYRNLGRPAQAWQDLNVLESGPAHDPRVTAEVAFERGRLHYFQGAPEAARQEFAQALNATASHKALLHLRGRVHCWLGWCLAEAFFDPTGFEHYERALECLRQAKDPYEEEAVRVRYACHRLFFQKGATRSDFEPLLERAERAGDHLNRVRALIGLGVLEVERERRPAAALRTFRRAMSIAEAAGLRREEGFVTMWIALTLDELGDVRGACASHEAAIALANSVGDDRLSALNQIYFAGCLARTDDTEAARRVLSTVGEVASTHPSRDPLRRLVDLQWGQLELSEARRARSAGATARFRALSRRAMRRVEQAKGGSRASKRGQTQPLVTRTEAARFLIRRIEDDHQRVAGQGVRIELNADASRFRVGEWPAVSLSRSPVLRRALLLLADAHAKRPGQGVSVDELVASGWPDERMRPESKVERVRNVVKRLRRAGLAGALKTRGGEFFLDPDLSIERVGADPSP